MHVMLNNERGTSVSKNDYMYAIMVTRRRLETVVGVYSACNSSAVYASRNLVLFHILLLEHYASLERALYFTRDQSHECS